MQQEWLDGNAMQPLELAAGNRKIKPRQTTGSVKWNEVSLPEPPERLFRFWAGEINSGDY